MFVHVHVYICVEDEITCTYLLKVFLDIFSEHNQFCSAILGIDLPYVPQDCTSVYRYQLLFMVNNHQTFIYASKNC